MKCLNIAASGGTMGGVLQSRYCGGRLCTVHDCTENDVIRDCTPPFEVSFKTDAAMDGTDATIADSINGFCLDYEQEACGASPLS